MELIYIAEAIIILPLILIVAAWVMDRKGGKTMRK